MNSFSIISQTKGINGIEFVVQVREVRKKLVFTYHSIERARRWEIPVNDIIETLLFPEEVVLGHHSRFIAHKRYENHLIRAVYEYQENIPVLVTVYFPNVERYFGKGGVYADKILT